MNGPTRDEDCARKAGAVVLVAVLGVLGLLGLVLPIIPGLLLLAIGAFVAARHFPWIDEQLRRHRGIDRQLRKADRYRHLSPIAQLQIAGWLCVKAMLDGLAFLHSTLSRKRL